MRIVEMHPGEEWTVPPPLKPSQRRVGHLVGASFGASVERAALVKLLVERVEALVESERRGHRVCADERRRRVTAPLQSRRQRWVGRAKRKDDVAANAVCRRVLPGQNRGVRRDR